MRGHAHGLTAVAFTPDGKFFATADAGGHIELRDGLAGSCVGAQKQPPAGAGAGAQGGGGSWRPDETREGFYQVLPNTELERFFDDGDGDGETAAGAAAAAAAADGTGGGGGGGAKARSPAIRRPTLATPKADAAAVAAAHATKTTKKALREKMLANLRVLQMAFAADSQLLAVCLLDKTVLIPLATYVDPPSGAHLLWKSPADSLEVPWVDRKPSGVHRVYHKATALQQVAQVFVHKRACSV